MSNSPSTASLEALNRSDEAAAAGNALVAFHEIVVGAQGVLRYVAPTVAIADLAVFDRGVLAAGDVHPFRTQVLAGTRSVGGGDRLVIESRHTVIPY
jgi:hypothetical protein